MSHPLSEDERPVMSAEQVHQTSRHETEEEYDARLEREEKERIEAARRHELKNMQENYKEGTTTSGVRFKGWYLSINTAQTYIKIYARTRPHEIR
jgi:hypothetical protein